MNNVVPRFLLIDGANGYLGSHLVQAAVAAGFTVHALVRVGTAQTEQDLLRQLGARVFCGELKVPEACSTAEKAILSQAFTSCSLAIHLIGSIAPKKGETFSGLHEGKSLAFAQWCKLCGVERVGMVTALGASAQSASQYLASKHRAEETMREHLGEKLVVLRPSLIVGRAVGKRDSKLVKRYRELIAARPMVPLINGGKNLIQPVDVRDLAKAILCALDSQKCGVLEIGGAQVLTMRDFVLKLMVVAGVKKPILALPALFAGALACLLEFFQAVPLVSKDQVLLAQLNNVCADNQLETLLGEAPRSLEESLATYEEVNFS